MPAERVSMRACTRSSGFMFRQVCRQEHRFPPPRLRPIPTSSTIPSTIAEFTALRCGLTGINSGSPNKTVTSVSRKVENQSSDGRTNSAVHSG
jgi:hypothetical protein